jgi:hypothetical protein
MKQAETSNLNTHRSSGKVRKYIQAEKIKYVNDLEGN